MTEDAVSPIATRRATSPRLSPALLGAGALGVLVALAYLFNLVIVDEVRRTVPDSTLTPTFGFAWSLGLSVAAGVFYVGIAKLFGYARPDVSWGSITYAYIISSLWHCISGLSVIYLGWTSGLPGAGQSIVIGLNPLGLDSPFGRYLGFLSVDELLHLVTFAWLVGRLYRWRRPWWLHATCILPWLAATWVLNFAALRRP